MPASLSRLKNSVKEHRKGRDHQQRSKDRSSAKRAERVSVAGTVSIRVGRTAHFILKSFMPRERFEELVVLQHINRLDMGRRGHSSRQISQFLSATHEVLMKELRGHVTAQPCIALMADKVTANHRTINVTTLLSIVPAAPAGQLFSTYVVGAPVVIHHDVVYGGAVAEDGGVYRHQQHRPAGCRRHRRPVPPYSRAGQVPATTRLHIGENSHALSVGRCQPPTARRRQRPQRASLAVGRSNHRRQHAHQQAVLVRSRTGVAPRRSGGPRCQDEDSSDVVGNSVCPACSHSPGGVPDEPGPDGGRAGASSSSAQRTLPPTKSPPISASS